jgi:hypothetical protein
MSRAHLGHGRIAAAAVLAALGATALARPTSAAMTLSSLSNPTVQTLIDLGSDGVVSGEARFFDFSYAGTSSAPAAAAVDVQAIGSDDNSGLRFVGSWLASGGSASSSTISFEVAPLTNGTVATINLLANGTAPLPAAQTFVTATTSTDTASGSPLAPLLSTYDDGRTFPTDTTAADVDSASATFTAPQSLLAVTDTLTVVGGSGGVATASYLQNGFSFNALSATAVPEPGLGLALAVVVLGCRRGRDHKSK